jgi:hypothetical protein
LDEPATCDAPPAIGAFGEQKVQCLWPGVCTHLTNLGTRDVYKAFEVELLNDAK